MFRNLLLATYLLFFLYSAALSQSTKNHTIDSLLTEADIFISENPQKGLNYSMKAYNLALIINNQHYRLESMMFLAESYLGIGTFDKSILFVDSVKSIAQKNKNFIYQIASLNLQARINFKKNNIKGTYESLISARKIANKNKLLDEEVSIILQIGEYQKMQGRYNESLKTKKSALDIAQKLKNSKLISKCWKSIGSTYWYFSFYNEALEHFYKGFVINDALKDTIEIINALENINLCYRDIGNYEKAQSQLNKALEIIENNKFEIEKSSVLNSLGSLNYRFNRYLEAIQYYNQSLEIRKRLGLSTSTALTLENLARAYLGKNQYSEAISSLDEAYELRSQLNDQLATASTLNEMGNLYNQKGNIAEALRRYLQSLKIRQQSGDNKEIAKSYTNIGLTYRKLGLINYATKYLEQAKQLINIDDPKESSYILINLGNLYLDQKNYIKAIDVFQEAVYLREKTGDEVGIAKSLRSLALAQQQLKQYDKSLNNLQKSLKIVRKLNDGKSIADALNDLGNIERQRGRLKEALKYFEQATQTYDESAVFDGKALCLRKTGEVQILLGDLSNAEKNINSSINLGKEIANLTIVHLGYLAKHDLLKAKNNYKLAYDFYVKHIKLRDSIDHMRRSEANLEAQLDLELDKKKEELRLLESEIELLRKEAVVKALQMEKQRLIQIILIFISILILTISGGIIYLYLQKKKHNKELIDNIELIKDMNDKLAQSEIDLLKNIQTKNKLFSIIAHDLRSPFTGLVGLTSILSSKSNSLTKEEIEEYSKQINISSERLLTLIENLLTWSRSQTGKIILNPEVLDLTSEVDSCFVILGSLAEAKKIQLISKMKRGITLYADKETLNTVLRNLISNAIKFTNPNGKIEIGAITHASSVEIIISDNGVGIEPKNLQGIFQINKNTSTLGTQDEKGTGLGLIICKEFIELNKGKISVESEVSVGTSFKITLPKSSQNEKQTANL